MNFPWPKERKASRTDKMQNLSADSVRSSSQSSPNSLKRSTALAFETSAVLNPIGSDGSTVKASLDSDLRQSNSNMLPAVVQQLIATVSTADARHCFKPMNKLKFDETEIDLGSWEKPLQKVQHPENETAKVSPQTNCSQSLSKPGHGEDCPGWLPWLSSDKKVGIVGQRWQTCPVSAKACARASKEQVGPSCTPASCQKHHCQIDAHYMILLCLAYHIAVWHCMTAFPSFSLYTQPLLQLREKSMRGTKRTGWRSRWRWRLPQRCWDERKGATNSNELLDIAGRSGRPIDCGPIMAHLSPRNNSRSGKRGDLWQCQGHRATRVPTPLLLVFPQCSWPEKTANDFDMLQLHSIARVWPSDKKPPFKLSIAGSRHLSSEWGFWAAWVSRLHLATSVICPHLSTISGWNGFVPDEMECGTMRDHAGPWLSQRDSVCTQVQHMHMLL